MTVHSHSQKQKELPSFGECAFGCFTVFCLLLILKNPDVAITYMNQGLLLCAKTVIPSLFPFMVLSELIVSGGIGNRMLRVLAAPFRRLFALPTAACRAVLLGWLCGSPIGARCTVLALSRGELTREEAERALAVSNNPSSAFLISAVGVSLWQNRRFGIALYAAVLLSAAITGILLSIPHRKRNQRHRLPREELFLSPPQTGAKLFSGAVRAASGNMLLVCAYVVFFSTLVGTLQLIFTSFGVSETLAAPLFCLFELSGGVSRASALGNTLHAALLCAFAAGWSGLSVHCQVLSVCDGATLSFRPYFRAKLLQSLLCTLLFFLLLHLFPSLTVPAQGV